MCGCPSCSWPSGTEGAGNTGSVMGQHAGRSSLGQAAQDPQHGVMRCWHPAPGRAPSLQGSRGQPHGWGLRPFLQGRQAGLSGKIRPINPPHWAMTVLPVGLVGQAQERAGGSGVWPEGPGGSGVCLGSWCVSGNACGRGCCCVSGEVMPGACSMPGQCLVCDRMLCTLCARTMPAVCWNDARSMLGQCQWLLCAEMMPHVCQDNGSCVPR